MNPSLWVAMFSGSVALFATAAAVLVIWKCISERRDEMRYGRMRPAYLARPFLAFPLFAALGASGSVRPDSFAAIRDGGP